MSPSRIYRKALLGAWKLDHFEEMTEGDTYQYVDILIFSQKYYSNFQSDRTGTTDVHCHVGTYNVSDDSISFQIQLSNKSEHIGRVARAIYSIVEDYLKITFTLGEQPGTWVYKRLEET